MASKKRQTPIATQRARKYGQEVQQPLPKENPVLRVVENPVQPLPQRILGTLYLVVEVQMGEVLFVL